MRFQTVIRIFWLLPVVLFLWFCKGNPTPVKVTSSLHLMDDTLIIMNKNIVQAESEEIEDYILRHQWQMKVTKTGLRYMIYIQGKGIRAFPECTAKIRYSISLLNGIKITDPDKPLVKTFCLGRGEAENGLEEGILLLKTGDRVKFIVPSHLAFGLLGNLENIPERATLVYDVQLLEVKASH